MDSVRRFALHRDRGIERAFWAEVRSREALLPREAVEIVDAAATVRRVQSMGPAIGEGRGAAGVLELGSMVASVGRAQRKQPEIMKGGEGVEDHMKVVLAEFSTKLKQHTAKIDQVDDLAGSVKAKFGKIQAACETWDFAATPFVGPTGGASMPEAAQIQAAVRTFPTQRNTHELLAKEELPDELAEKSAITQCCDKLQDIDEKLSLAALIIGECILAQELFNQSSRPDKDKLVAAQRFVTETLAVSESLFPAKLTEKLRAAAAPAAGTASPAKVAEGGGGSQPEPPQQSQPTQPRRKYRKLGA